MVSDFSIMSDIRQLFSNTRKSIRLQPEESPSVTNKKKSTDTASTHNGRADAAPSLRGSAGAGLSVDSIDDDLPEEVIAEDFYEDVTVTTVNIPLLIRC